MAFTSGTATDFIDLVRKFRTFVFDGVTGAGWLPAAGGGPETNTEGVRNYLSTNNSAENLFNNSITSDVRLHISDTITMEFVEAKEIGSIKLFVPDKSGGGYLAEAPKSVTLKTSDDGVVWDTTKTWTNIGGWNDLTPKQLYLDSPVVKKYIRFQVTESYSGNYAYLSLLYFYDASGDVSYLSHDNNKSFEFFAKSPYVSANGLSMNVCVRAYMSDAAPYYAIGALAGVDLVQTSDPLVGIPYPQYYDFSSSTYASAWDAPMPYWFYGDERSVYAVYKVSNTYRPFGFGYILPYFTPAQYALPIFVGAESSSTTVGWSLDYGGDVKGFPNPGNKALYLFNDLNAWQEIQNYRSLGTEDDLYPGDGRLWPGYSTDYNSLRNAPGTDNVNGNYQLFPLIVKDQARGVIFGEIPNVYLVPALNLTSEDTITVGGDTYRVFQNGWRTSPQDFFAVKEA